MLRLHGIEHDFLGLRPAVGLFGVCRLLAHSASLAVVPQIHTTRAHRVDVRYFVGVGKFFRTGGTYLVGEPETEIRVPKSVGFVVDHFGWNWYFILMLAACTLAFLFISFTYKEEQYLVKGK